MGIVFVVGTQAVAVTTAVDFFEILMPAVRSGILKEVHITQSTEAGDAAAEMLRYAIKKCTGSITSGSGGTTPTPASVVPGVTFSSTVEANNTTKLVVGTGVITILEEQCEHVANGFHYVAPDGGGYEFEGASRVVIGLEAAPADSITFSTVCKFEIIGGI